MTPDPIEYAAERLPEGYYLEISVQKGTGMADLMDPYGECIDIADYEDGPFAARIIRLVDAAVADAKRGAE